MSITTQPFGTVDGRDVDLFTLKNANGMVARITNYGGIVTSLVLPDGTDIVCGFDTLAGYFSEAYKANSPYFGCIVGRYAARVKDGKIKVGDQVHTLACNAGPNHIHGGVKGFDKCVWDAGIAGDALRLALTSPDGDEGYPGELKVVVLFRLTDANELVMEASATTSKTTAVSLTNHTYFNLNGFTGKILAHEAMIDSAEFLVADDTGVPLGEKAAVEGSVLDYRKARPIGDVFGEYPQGFEHFYCFGKPLGAFAKVAAFKDPESGRTMEVSTTEPGMLMYSGFYTADNLMRESGAQFGQFRAFCCEASRYPNGPNIAGSPGSLLRPGEQYTMKTAYKIGW